VNLIRRLVLMREKGQYELALGNRGRTDFSEFDEPTLVPKPGSPTVTQSNLPRYELAAKRGLGLA
jgi:hypothetical protein